MILKTRPPFVTRVARPVAFWALLVCAIAVWCAAGFRLYRAVFPVP